ncbi:hypothetical protein [Piscinibacter terrae]|uniref:Uncharacterized protein n=1 Tax=Piscinibacter terrae TaxID=2496871 RepID=A0A3N7HGR0_9BURK|nr:hypothetical protein [Albitalea terrae]RQP21158.1 hypothetical protein DZC73_29300 [Albitalea terrae]
MSKFLQILVPAIAASAAGFLPHKLFADWLPHWVGAHMEGVQIKVPPYGPEVVVPAALTYIEPGLAYLAAYVLVRKATPTSSVFVRALLVAALCLGLEGSIVRMPLMQLVIGNPLWVTLLQHAGIWVPYVAASLVVAYTFELVGKLGANPSIEWTDDGRLRPPSSAAHVKR